MRDHDRTDGRVIRPLTTALVATLVAATLAAVPALAQDEASPAPGAEAASEPTIRWETDQVSLRADTFSVEANDRVFTTQGAPLGADSDPGGSDYWTLEVTWLEQDREQRLNMYFGSDGTDWWVDEIRTYDGYKRGEWIYYEGPLFRTPLGEAHEGDVRLEGKGTGRPRNKKKRVPGVLTLEGLRLTVSPRTLEDIAALPDGGGMAATSDPFGPGGPLRCTDILMLDPSTAHERILEAGYRVSWRLEHPREPFRALTVPPDGVIESTALDSYGNVVVFVIDPSLPAPQIQLPADCTEPSQSS